MSTESPGLTTSPGDYNDTSNTAIIVVLIIFSSFAVIANLFAVISIIRHTLSSIIGFFVCLLSIVELLHAIACGTTTLYSFLKTQHSFEQNSTLCNFYAWLYIIFRLKATLLVSLLTFDRVLLSLRPTFYVRKWTSFRTRWILPSSVFLVALLLASLPVVTSSYDTSPDGRRFHCLFRYAEGYAVFYIAFYFVQAVSTCVAMSWVISREKRVDAKLSVLVVGDMVVCREASNVVNVRNGLKISRLVLVVVVLYHTCSVLLPLLLLLRFFDVDYPAVVGLLAIQLPTFGASFLPVIYGLTWRPYRKAYYSSVAFLCPSATAGVQTRRVRSIHNPAYRDTQEHDANSIFHTRGITLHQTTSPPASTLPSNSTRSKPLELDPRKLIPEPLPGSDDVSRRLHGVLPRNPSFQDRHLYMPSKFQNIFEIIEALSAPHRRASDNSSDCSSNATRDRQDSLSSLGTASPVKLTDVSVDVKGTHLDSFNDVNFSAIRVSSSRFNNRVIDKVKLDLERKNSKCLHSDGSYRRQDEQSSSLSGPIRFTDLRNARTETKPESLADDSEQVKLDSERKDSFKNLHLQDIHGRQDEESSSLAGPVRFTDLRKAREESRPESPANDSEHGGKAKLDSEQKEPFKDIHSGEIPRRQYEESSSLTGPVRFTDLKKARDDTRSESLANDSGQAKLDSENEEPFKDIHSGEIYRRQYEEPSSPSRPIRFTDLRKVRTELPPENSTNDSKLGNRERFMRYLASETYVNSN